MTEPSMRERVRKQVQSVVWNASNYPKRVQQYILGQDIAPLSNAITDAILPLIEEAVTAERERCAGIAESNLGRRWVARETVGDIAAAIRGDREPEPATEVTPCGAIVCTGCRVCGCTALGIAPATEDREELAEIDAHCHTCDTEGSDHG